MRTPMPVDQLPSFKSRQLTSPDNSFKFILIGIGMAVTFSLIAIYLTKSDNVITTDGTPGEEE